MLFLLSFNYFFTRNTISISNFDFVDVPTVLRDWAQETCCDTVIDNGQLLKASTNHAVWNGLSHASKRKLRPDQDDTLHYSYQPRQRQNRPGPLVTYSFHLHVVWSLCRFSHFISFPFKRDYFLTTGNLNQIISLLILNGNKQLVAALDDNQNNKSEFAVCREVYDLIPLSVGGGGGGGSCT